MLINERKPLYNFFSVNISAVFNWHSVNHFIVFTHPIILNTLSFTKQFVHLFFRDETFEMDKPIFLKEFFLFFGQRFLQMKNRVLILEFIFSIDVTISIMMTIMRV